MYELINQDEADRIKEILEITGLYKDIKIEVDKYKVNAFSVSESNTTEHHQPFNMKEFYLLDNENALGVLEYKNKKYDAFVNVGQWGYETRLKDTHITLGSSKFHDFCLQIELSQAVSDDKYIYVVKNVSNMAGPGAICRLYRGLKNDRDEKLKRQQLFTEKYGNEVIRYKNKDWIVISKIYKEDLHDDTKAEQIFYDLIYNMFFAMLLVENIGEQGENK
jgi:hypothetical protein